MLGKTDWTTNRFLYGVTSVGLNCPLYFWQNETYHFVFREIEFEMCQLSTIDFGLKLRSEFSCCVKQVRWSLSNNGSGISCGVGKIKSKVMPLFYEKMSIGSPFLSERYMFEILKLQGATMIKGCQHKFSQNLCRNSWKFSQFGHFLVYIWLQKVSKTGCRFCQCNDQNGYSKIDLRGISLWVFSFYLLPTFNFQG